MISSAVTAYIGLGSNLQSPTEQVLSALNELAQLPDCRLLARSSLYRSDPVGPAGQPDYINAVAALETRLSPLALLDHLQAIESNHQRQRLQHWGPRTLDLDLLLYGQQLIDQPRLRVPHYMMQQRNFVLYPLAEISPTLQMPDGTPLSSLLASCPMGTLEKLAL